MADQPLPVIYTEVSPLHALLIIVFSSIACIVVILRLLARKIQNISFTLSDYVIVLGLIFALGESVLNLYGCCFPEAWKASDKSFQSLVLGAKLSFISPIIWVAAVTTIRASIVILYIHIFVIRSFRLVCYGVLALNLLFVTATILADCLICQPLSFRWDPTIKGGSCGDIIAVDLFVAIGNLLQDVVVVILPMPVLWSLQRATGRKLAVSCMFGLGIAICAVTSYRVYITSTIKGPDRNSLKAQKAYCLIALLTSLEVLLGIITACLPMLRPVALASWSYLPKTSRDKFTALTTKASSIIVRACPVLSMPNFSHGSKSFNWFSTSSKSYERQSSVVSGEWNKTPEIEEHGVSEKKTGQIYVRQEYDVESVVSDL